MKGWRFLAAVLGMMVLAGFGGCEMQAGPADIREIVVLSPVDAARLKRSPGFYEASSWAAWADPCAKTSGELEGYLRKLGVSQVKMRAPDEGASEDVLWEAVLHLQSTEIQMFRGRKVRGGWEFDAIGRR